jgi:ABC-2 type transport system permease protein
MNEPVRVERVLAQLYLKLFLRGRSARGISKKTAPSSVPQKFALTLLGYLLCGCVAAAWWGQPVFGMALTAHGMTFFLLGTFITASAGDLLFEKQEADILLHRPIPARALLWAKVSALVRVSLWLGLALNLPAALFGLAAPDATLAFPVVHLLSSALEALLVAGLVVLVYELCLRWFGRERLDTLIATSQVLVALTAVLVSQAPRLLMGTDGRSVRTDSAWLWLLPPGWFAGIDEALAGGGGLQAWLLAGCALALTFSVLGVAFGKLANVYEEGLERMQEAAATAPSQRGVRWLSSVAAARPLVWWLRDAPARAAFVLCGVYLARDRDTKLRVYPSVAAFVILPFVSMATPQTRASLGGFEIAFAGAFLALVGLSAVSVLEHSQQYRAAEIFRQVPLPNPAPLSRGVRAAVFSLLQLPVVLLAAGLVAWRYDIELLLLLLPGCAMAPAFSLIPCLGDHGAPFSRPVEDARAASGILRAILASALSLVVAILATWSWHRGWFGPFLVGHAVVVSGVTAALLISVRSAEWSSPD